jgi:cytochrome P450
MMTTDSLLNNPLIPYASFTLGVLSHLLFFHHGERHLYPYRYIQFYLLLLGILTVARSHYLSIPTSFALKSNALLFTIYFSGLYTSLIIYRLFFNPLNRFPGPFFARLSKFNHVLRNTKFDGHHQLLALHQKHGRFVRIGPNDLSVTHPDGVQVVSTANSKCTKAAWYSQDLPLMSMHTTRDRAMHDRRRRAWAPAFSDRALRGYETRIQKYNRLMFDNIDKNLGKPLNMSELFNHYSFDVMGDLAFGKPFDMLTTGETHWAIKLLNEGMDPMGFGFPPWFFRIVIAIPGAAKGYWDFINFCTGRLMERVGEQDMKKKALQGKGKDIEGAGGEGGGGEEKDITYTLIEQFQGMSEADQKAALPMLQGDSRLIIVAGSDTTAATLVHLWYYIAKENLTQQLREELAPLVGSDGVVEHHKIQDAELLNGCIYEALRLNPPVPSGVFRKTPKGGVMVGGEWVPGETCVQMPQFVMGRGTSTGPCSIFHIIFDLLPPVFM